MLTPKMTRTRDVRVLDGTWRFAVDWDNDLDPKVLTAQGLPGDLDIAVPASVNDLFTDRAIRDHVGYWWYQRTVQVPPGWEGKQIFVHFGSATHHARVWVGPHDVGSFKGGYMPFELDITEHVTAGEKFTLTVRIDNRLDNSCIPPGEVTQLADGRRVQNYLHDFYNYTGIHRSVSLVARDAAHVSDVTISTSFTTDPDGSHTAAVSWDAELSAAALWLDGAEVRAHIIDKQTGETVAEGRGACASQTIENATLWRPGHGGLYDLVLTLVDASGNLRDEYPQHFGVRTVEVRDQQFLINGEPFYFTGFGMHEDHETIGKGHNDAHMIQDFQLLDWIGANSLRTSHYPYAEEFMDYCDRHGIVVIDETPAVGLNWAMEGGILDSDGGETFSPGHVDETTQAQHKLEIERLIARDKNRPSVVLWSIANEPDSASDRARDYFAPLAKLARDCDPTRPVGFVNVMFATAARDTITDLFDVIMLNRYNGWYAQTGDLKSAEDYMRDELSQWEEHNKPIIYTEFGADTVAGIHSVFANAFSEEFQVEYLTMCARVFDSSTAVVGEQMWNFADFQTKFGVARVDGNKKGAFTRDRHPKAAAHYLRGRWHHE